MKRCPNCKRDFYDDTLSFCLEDGTPLVTETAAVRPDSQETLVSPRPSGVESSGGSASTQSYRVPGKETISASPYQAPTHVPAPARRKTWPWVLGVFAVLAVVAAGILIVVFTVPGVLRPAENVNHPPKPTPTRQSWESPTPSPTPTSDVPTDSAQVLAQLTQLEKDWTEANLKGDKEALEKILADEYVGNTDNSRTKREYLDSLKADDSVEEWEISDVTVNQTGERAVVNGSLKEVTDEETIVYDFVDTFVWRDHRWQAVTSHATRVK